MSFIDINNITIRENNIVDDSYLDDLTDASDYEDHNQRFCNSCGYQVFQITYRNPDIFKCSNCGRVFSIAEKKNLVIRERMAPILQNNNLLETRGAEVLDPYEPLEKEKNREKNNEIINSLIGNTDSSVSLTKKRKFDNDEQLLINKGLTIIDVD